MNTLLLKTLKLRLSEFLHILISLACLSLLVYTAREKITDHERFMDGLSRVSFIGSMAERISWLVPGLEIVTAILILIPQTNRIGLWSFLTLMSLFTLYILVALIWLDRLPCHCGGIIESLSWREHLLFNLGFIFLSGLALWLTKKSLITKFQLQNYEQL